MGKPSPRFAAVSRRYVEALVVDHGRAVEGGFLGAASSARAEPCAQPLEWGREHSRAGGAVRTAARKSSPRPAAVSRRYVTALVADHCRAAAGGDAAVAAAIAAELAAVGVQMLAPSPSGTVVRLWEWVPPVPAPAPAPATVAASPPTGV